MQVTKKLLAVLAAIVLTVVLPACGDDDDTTTDDPTTDDAGDDAVDGEDDAMDDEGGETVAVTAVDYGYDGLPGTVAAGTTIELTNASEAEVHELVAVRIPDDDERSVEELLALPEEELEPFFPLVATVIVAPPGEAGFAVEGTGVLDEPGRYLIACFIPTGADPAEFMAAAADPEAEGPPDVAGGPPHFVNGMSAELIVE